MSNSKLPGIIVFVVVAAALVAFYLNDRGQLSFGGADAMDHSTMDHSTMEHAGHGAESHDGFSGSFDDYSNKYK
jgi:ABC-type cobalt transport system substrate-binding protein